MDATYGQAAYLISTVVMFALRSPFIRRSTQVPVQHQEISLREKLMLTLVGITMIVLPLLWMLTDWLAIADYPLQFPALVCGLAIAVLGLWLLHRSHVDLGRNWSNTLQLREGHELVEHGVYRRARHPMYAALLLHATGQALFLPNLIAGPAYLVAFSLLVTTRMGPEERMMQSRFGDLYSAYRSRTWRLIPRIW